MFCKNLFPRISLALFVISSGFVFAACPSADLSGDCFIDYEDFVVMAGRWLNSYGSQYLVGMANQWLTTDPNVPYDMAYIPDGGFEMGDHFSEADIDERPVHAVLLDTFFMSKFEITNQQYCDYLNSAEDAGDIKVDGGIVYASSDNSNSYPYCDMHSADHDSQIDYLSEVFSVTTKDGRDMSDDPMVEVSWYGAVSYCNWRSSEEGYEGCYNLSTWEYDLSKHGYRLPTEAEWEYAARGGLSGKRFPWNDPNISHSQANYDADPCSYSYDVNPNSGYHPDWEDGIRPYTSVVGSFGANGYGLYDMAGNVREWCNDWYGSYEVCEPGPCDNPTGPVSGDYRVLHGGSWEFKAYNCRVARRLTNGPSSRNPNSGFRIVLDLNPMPSLEGSLDIELSVNKSWMYQNLPSATASNLTANGSIIYDRFQNIGYTYDWEIILPDDVTGPPAIIDGGTANYPFCNIAAPPCDDFNGLSDSGLAFTVKVTVTGNNYGNTATAEAQFGVALLGDVNNDGAVNVADRSIINAFWRTGTAGGFTLRDCDLNCDGSINIADRSIANAIWRGVLGQNSVNNPCPLR